MPVARRGELTERIVAEQREVRRVAAVGDGERATQVVAGLDKVHAGDRAEGDVLEVEEVAACKARDGTAEVRRSVEHERRAARIGDRVRAGQAAALDLRRRAA